MPLYESVFIARNDLTQAQVEAIADQVAEIIGTTGGEVKKREYWGLRGLAYRIKKNRKGHYMLLGMECPPAAEQEVARQFGLNEDILRHMTLRVEEIDPEAPSAILAKRADDRERDRGFRGPRPAGRFGSGRGRERDDREEFRARGRDDGDEGGGEYRPRGGEE
ncbi:SSU ribosomal protein S6P [Humitalea rosea]|uniref:Small ribosomal subunit protein bS6 n=1 Tax=Humitalea rosea TaxID=990373 RepID=A0A2W7IUD5_9PROT|nr:30S ribosomal protein S6 [Humitalea rosea]PZW42283.1 SSU ribosomal protein S6P [Humitalea rosea]